jgi:hypothetical protein
MTQCIDSSKIRGPGLKSYCENLLRKINVKNGGINTKINFNGTLNGKISENDRWMVFGADVIHPTNVSQQHPSIAGRLDRKICR